MYFRRSYVVYIVASRSRNLYTGIARNLQRRLPSAKTPAAPAIPIRSRIHRLVHYEVFSDIRAAIAREKEIKSWPRGKKVALIASNNPNWANLLDQLSSPPGKN
jgi:putative endonuclease